MTDRVTSLAAENPNLLEALKKKGASGRCILIAGTGFSFGAINKLGDALPSTAGLTELLLDQAKVPVGDRQEFTLPTAIQAYNEFHRDDSRLAIFLSSHLTAKRVSKHHELIANVPWYRIYTTNYDDVLEESFKGNGIYCETFDQTGHASIRKKDIPQIIHLHGYVASTNPREEPTRFIASVQSYAEPDLYESEWLRQMERDVENAPAIFVVGHSLSDNHIARILKRRPEFRSKIYTVTEPNPPLALAYALKVFGQNFAIGVDGFGHLCGEIDRDVPSETPLPPCLEKLEFDIPSADPTARDIDDLLLKGRIDRGFIFKQISGESGVQYFIERVGTDSNALKDFSKRILFAHSNVGNGKSLYLTELASALARDGMNVFLLHPERGFISECLHYLGERKFADVLIVEDIFQHENLLTEIMQIPRSDIVFLLSSKTAIFEVKFPRISKDFAGRFIESDLNQMDDRQLERASELLGQFGYWRERASYSEQQRISYLAKKCQREMRAILLSLLESPSIKARLSTYFNQINALPARAREFIVLTTYSRLIGGDMDVHTIGTIMQYDYYKDIFSYRRTLDQEIFMPSGDIRFRSSVFGEFFLKNYVDDTDLLSFISRFVRALDTFATSTPSYLPVLRQALRYRYIRGVMTSSLANAYVDKFFEPLHTIKIAQRDPLFWVQASIAKSANGGFDFCENYIATARSLAKRRQGYDEYQIDTHEAKFLIESRLSGYKKDFGAAICTSARRVLGVIRRREEDLVLPLEVVTQFPEFYHAFKEVISEQEVADLRETLSDILKYISKYSEVVLSRNQIGQRSRAAISNVINTSEAYR